MEIDKSIIEELKNLEKKLLKSKIRKSSIDLTEILADEFVEFGSSGNIYYKKQIIEALQKEVTPKMSLSNFSSLKLGKNYFLVKYKAVKNENGKKNYSLRSSIWKLNNGKWQMIFHQGTLIKK